MRVPLPDALPDRTAEIEALHLKQRVANQAQPGARPFEAARFLGEETEVTHAAFCRGEFD
jgi:hypothetical protein